MATHCTLVWTGVCTPVRLSFQQLFTDYRTVWHELAAARGLVESDILQLNDGQFADFVFSWDYDMFGDGSKLRRAGFTAMRATDEMFFSLFAQLRAARIIPRQGMLFSGTNPLYSLMTVINGLVNMREAISVLLMALPVIGLYLVIRNGVRSFRQPKRIVSDAQQEENIH